MGILDVPSSSFVRTSQRVSPFGKTQVAFIGDSITAGGDTYQSTLTWATENNNSPALYALMSGNGNWELIQNAGVSGQTSTQILSRLSTDVLSNPVDICVIFSCTWNDIGQSVPLAQSLANVTSMIKQCQAAGVLPVLCTPTPDGQTGSSAARRNGAAQRRRNFIALGRTYNIPVVDLFTVLVDPTTGLISSTYNADGSVHANPAGRKALGQAVNTVLNSICVGSAVSDIGYAGDTDDLLAGKGFMLNAPVSGVAGGWTGGGAVTGATPSIYSDSVLGNMQRITTSATAANYYITGGISVTAGHMYELSGFISKSGTSTAQISVNGTGNRRVTVNGTDPDLTRGRFNIRAVANATESMTYYLVTGPGTGTVDFGRLTVRDLTALGIA